MTDTELGDTLEFITGMPVRLRNADGASAIAVKDPRTIQALQRRIDALSDVLGSDGDSISVGIVR